MSTTTAELIHATTFHEGARSLRRVLIARPPNTNPQIAAQVPVVTSSVIQSFRPSGTQPEGSVSALRPYEG
jgi:hypothetical protein